jgi:hypothetical protein
MITNPKEETMELTAENVETIIKDCLFKEIPPRSGRGP